MRSCLGFSLLILLCFGCNRAEEARRKAVENNLKQIGAALQNYQQAHQSSDSQVSDVDAVKQPEATAKDVSEIVEGGN